MACEHFEDHNFYGKGRARIMQANEIIAEYAASGLKLTLRQLYYQFVARGFIANKQTEYAKLGNTISNARLAGLIDWDAIEDRTRFLRGIQTWNSPSERLRAASRGYAIDMWENQDTRIEVWIEKDALIGVIEQVCNLNYIDFFACRGYVSQSELYEAGKRIEDYLEQGYNVNIIHLGDHDPSGIDMTRDNEERLRMFSRADAYGYDDMLTIDRIALNMDQVRNYNPPPNPAKITDTRAPDYIARYGRSSWELDALEPRVLRDLIQDKIDVFKDLDAWEIKEIELKKHREILDEAVEFARNRQDEM